MSAPECHTVQSATPCRVPHRAMSAPECHTVAFNAPPHLPLLASVDVQGALSAAASAQHQLQQRLDAACAEAAEQEQWQQHCQELQQKNEEMEHELEEARVGVSCCCCCCRCPPMPCSFAHVQCMQAPVCACVRHGALALLCSSPTVVHHGGPGKSLSLQFCFPRGKQQDHNKGTCM